MHRYRKACFFRWITALILGLTVVVFVPPLRNNLPGFPRAWRPASTFQIIRLNINTVSGHMAALPPCTEPRTLGSDADQHPISSATAHSHTQGSNEGQSVRPEDKAMYDKARRWVNSSKQRQERFSRYLPQLTLEDKAKLLHTWRVLHRACQQHNISYFLVEGSLLGAFRHKGLVPWDDDMDVAVQVADAENLQRILSCIPGYTLRVQSNMHWKFFAEDAKVVGVSSKTGTLHAKVLSERQKKGYVLEFQDADNVVMRYPFVDIFLVQSDEFYTWAKTNYISKTTMFSTADIYPLTEVPFEGYMAPVPRHSHDLLNLMYEPNKCLSPFHNHKKGRGIHDVSEVPCEELESIYPVFHV